MISICEGIPIASSRSSDPDDNLTDPHRWSRRRRASSLSRLRARARAASTTHEFIFKPRRPAPKSRQRRRRLQRLVDGRHADDQRRRRRLGAKVKLAEGVAPLQVRRRRRQWLPDPTADKSLEVDDGHGGKNPACWSARTSRKFPPPKPNTINARAGRLQPNDAARRQRRRRRRRPASARPRAGGRRRSRSPCSRCGDEIAAARSRCTRWTTNVGLDRFGGLIDRRQGRRHSRRRSRRLRDRVD